MIPQVITTFNRRKTATATSKGSVEIVISHDGKRRFLSTGIRITTKEWRNGIIVGENAVQYNRILKSLVTQVNTAISEMVDNESIDITAISIQYQCDNVDLMEWLLDNRKCFPVKDSTFLNYIHSVNRLRQFGITHTAECTQANCTRFCEALADELVGESAKNVMGKLRIIFDALVVKGIVKKNPWNIKVKLKKSKPNIKYLTESQLRTLKELKLTKFQDYARNVFLFAVYTGLSIVDIVKIDREGITYENNNAYIISKREKTGSPYRVMLNAKALAILEKYGYQFNLCGTQNVYLHLVNIGKKMNLPFRLSMHKARHTFATFALNHGIPLEIVSKMLAHADIKTTQIYAKVLQSSVDSAYDKLSDLL